jgi:hypothetical protein
LKFSLLLQVLLLIELLLLLLLLQLLLLLMLMLQLLLLKLLLLDATIDPHESSDLLRGLIDDKGHQLNHQIVKS